MEKLLANGVVAAINAPTIPFSQAFTATRERAPSHDLKNLDVLTVQVLSAGKVTELLTRSALFEHYRVAIVVQKTVADTSPAEVDPYADLMQEISDYLALKKLAGLEATWVGVFHDPLYDPDALLEENLFYSVLHCTYKLGRKPASN